MSKGKDMSAQASAPRAEANAVSLEPVAERAADVLRRAAAGPLPPGLYLVATPIGNLADMSLRALSVLARADVIYCEDTRHSRTLFAHYAINRPLQPYHEHNAREQRPRILAALQGAKRVALISDAGTPLVSDPGYKLVREAAAEGHAVVSIPGPSAVLPALTSSGLPTDVFLFAGFLPPRSAARRLRLEELAGTPATLLVFEAPTRLAETLADMAAVLGARPAAIARELTKLHEEVVRGSLTELAEAVSMQETKGEIVIVVGPPLKEAAGNIQIRDALAGALEEMTLRDAAKAVSDALGVPKARVYEIGLAMKRERG